MYLGQDIPVFSWFIIHFVENKGMAFGMELGGEYGKLILSLFRIVAVTVIAYFLAKLIKDKRATTGLIACIALIFAGAVGNIIDSTIYGLIFSASGFKQVAQFMPEGGGYASIFHGRVVDMLYFPLLRGYYPEWMPWVGGDYFEFFRPVFNIADSAISFGVFFIILFQRRFFKHFDKEETPSTNETPPATDPKVLDNFDADTNATANGTSTKILDNNYTNQPDTDAFSDGSVTKPITDLDLPIDEDKT